MERATVQSTGQKSYQVAICGNPNCGKTTIFNVMTGLKQKVGNYPGVTVDKVSGQFQATPGGERHTVIDVPGTYSLAAFSPDEFIAAQVMFGNMAGTKRPDAIIAVIDATNLERGLYLLYQVMQIGTPVVVALNMTDLAQKRGINIDSNRLSERLGGLPVVPVIGSRGTGIDQLKREVLKVIEQPPVIPNDIYDPLTSDLVRELARRTNNGYRSNAEYLRVLFDVNGPAEEEFVEEHGEEIRSFLKDSRSRLREQFGSLTAAETKPLTDHATDVVKDVTAESKSPRRRFSDQLDRFLLHPILGPTFLILVMTVVFQSIFSWAAPFMDMIDSVLGSFALIVQNSMAEGPLRSLIVNGIIGGVGAVLAFIPQIVILFLFIAFLEDSGYMPRAAFLVDRMFRWCGLSGKSFIPMLSSFACAIPGIMATRTIEDRKLRIITAMVAPLMTCSARLPVYAIMIAAFIPYKTYLGVFNLQGLVLTVLYLLGIFVAVVVSFILSRLLFKTERGSFVMEMPTYKLPTVRSIGIRVLNRAKAFIIRAGTVIFAITVIIWALSYYPHSDEIEQAEETTENLLQAQYTAQRAELMTGLSPALAAGDDGAAVVTDVREQIGGLSDEAAIEQEADQLAEQYPQYASVVDAVAELRKLEIDHDRRLDSLSNAIAGAHVRNSYFARVGHAIEPLFVPLGWDWKITMAVMASFPAREVIIAVLGTVYNLGSEVDEESPSLIEKMRNAKWESGEKAGMSVFTPAVALSIMVFFALCCQCGATVVTIRQETASWKYAIATFAYMTGLAYVLALATYQFFSWMGW